LIYLSVGRSFTVSVSVSVCSVEVKHLLMLPVIVLLCVVVLFGSTGGIAPPSGTTAARDPFSLYTAKSFVRRHDGEPNLYLL